MMSAAFNYILSCDWGTSSFRLRLVSLQGGEIKGEVSSGEGVAGVFNRWHLQKTLNRPDFYREVLRKRIRELSGRIPLLPDNIPLIISGMASSSIGMMELPYALLPFSLDGGKAIVQKLDARSDFPYETFLVSGLRNQQNVMRGEETQLLGLMSYFTENGEAALLNEGAVFIFPGTHSKHIYLRKGQITDFSTYMTGEVFQVLASHSILKEAVENNAGDKVREIDLEAFRLGVRCVGASGLSQSLFSVRVNQLFEKLDKRQNSHYLSGLLIGAELSNLQKKKARPLVLSSGSALFDLYKLAIHELGLLSEATFVQPELADRAAVNGHLQLFRQFRGKP